MQHQLKPKFPPFHRLRQNKSLTDPIVPPEKMPKIYFYFYHENLNQSKCLFIAGRKEAWSACKNPAISHKKRAEKQPVPFITGREPERSDPGCANGSDTSSCHSFQLMVDDGSLPSTTTLAATVKKAEENI
jgi:hypothetical protein